MTFYRPTDVEKANDELGAMCGHTALAALLGREVCDTYRAALHVFADRGWVSPGMMEEALRVLAPREWRLGSAIRKFPVRGLALIQFEGSWMEQGLPAGARLSRTHWIAIDRNPTGLECAYDVNQDAWTQRTWWEEETLPRVMAAVRGARGWHVALSYEVQPNVLPSVEARR